MIVRRASRSHCVKHSLPQCRAVRNARKSDRRLHGRWPAQATVCVARLQGGGIPNSR